MNKTALIDIILSIPEYLLQMTKGITDFLFKEFTVLGETYTVFDIFFSLLIGVLLGVWLTKWIIKLFI